MWCFLSRSDTAGFQRKVPLHGTPASHWNLESWGTLGSGPPWQFSKPATTIALKPGPLSWTFDQVYHIKDEFCGAGLKRLLITIILCHSTIAQTGTHCLMGHSPNIRRPLILGGHCLPQIGEEDLRPLEEGDSSADAPFQSSPLFFTLQR